MQLTDMQQLVPNMNRTKEFSLTTLIIMARSTALISFLLLIFCTQLNAQFADSLQVEIGTIATAASKEYQPLWLIANK